MKDFRDYRLREQNGKPGKRSVTAPFDSPDWVFEVKLDGYRAITVFDDSGTLTPKTNG